MLNVDALVATNNWAEERKEKGIDPRIRKALPMIFYSLDSLHYSVSKLTLPSRTGRRNETKSGKDSMIVSMFPSIPDYANFRSVLASLSDAYYILKQVKDWNLLELQLAVLALYKASNPFRELRNFFTHLDNIISNPEAHGISGPLETSAGIYYTATAERCFHLILEGTVIYFTYRHQALETDIARPKFNPIFEAARQVYAEITSHEIYKELKDYTPMEKLYPAFPS